MTAARRPRSAALLVGSTSSTSANVQSAGDNFKRFFASARTCRCRFPVEPHSSSGRICLLIAATRCCSAARSPSCWNCLQPWKTFQVTSSPSSPNASWGAPDWGSTGCSNNEPHPLAWLGMMISPFSHASCCRPGNGGWSLYGAPWLQPLATEPVANPIGAEAAKTSENVAVGCDQLREAAHGKEGVSGSSPEEGFNLRAGSSEIRGFGRSLLHECGEDVFERPAQSSTGQCAGTVSSDANTLRNAEF